MQKAQSFPDRIEEQEPPVAILAVRATVSRN
jgi:hypothetical protein